MKFNETKLNHYFFALLQYTHTFNNKLLSFHVESIKKRQKIIYLTNNEGMKGKKTFTFIFLIELIHLINKSLMRVARKSVNNRIKYD